MVPYNTGQFRIEAEAEPIESVAWLTEFAEGYIAGWNSADPAAVAKYVTEDTIWHDPSMSGPAHGRAGVEKFVADTVRSFPDVAYTNPFPPVLAADNRLAIVPWRMTGTHLGLIDPPGFAGTGKKFDVLVIDFWQFRSGLIWRSQASWDLQEMLLQLGLMPPRGSAAERAMARAQRVRSRLPF
ncbi:ester cyclase [Nocardia amamiensis]|uniref:ester cyclase n=1 Tax=Nocardia amamiensis TaxID=404578 RepID=UPI000832D914|nr:nuclear transport factor 2 family protein [Nocardia amamiensis]